MTNFKAIAAVAENGVIGRGLEIPWRISEDFRHFKRTTLGGVLLMGRRTWESLGSRPLPGAKTPVITSWPGEVSGARAVRFARRGRRRLRRRPAYGVDLRGAALYRAALPLCSELILSRVKLSPDGDVFFPDFSGLFEERETVLENEFFDVIRYVRK